MELLGPFIGVLIVVCYFIYWEFLYDPDDLFSGRYPIRIPIDPFLSDAQLRELYTIFPVYFSKTLHYIVVLNTMAGLFMIMDRVDIYEPTLDDLLSHGALSGEAVFNGDYWRIITYGFLQDGIGHIILWSLALTYTVGMVKDFALDYWVLLVYLLTTMVAGLATVFYNADLIITGSFSSVIGVTGFAYALILLKKAWFTWARVVYGFIAIFCAIFAILYYTTHWFTHITSFSTGFVLGVLFLNFLPRVVKH